MWWDRAEWRLPAEEAEDYRRRLEATGRYRCVVFPLREGEALLHVGGRDGGEAFRFRSRFVLALLLEEAPPAAPPRFRTGNLRHQLARRSAVELAGKRAAPVTQHNSH